MWIKTWRFQASGAATCYWKSFSSSIVCGKKCKYDCSWANCTISDRSKIEYYIEKESGLTNRQIALKGEAPYGIDGEKINLHHLTQTNTSGLAEVQATFHQKYTSTIHINPKTIPSGIDRAEFNKYRRAYWVNRANDFK